MSAEILVHISTPATWQNDNLYRSLAEAYLDFEPCQSHLDVIRRRDDGPDSLTPCMPKSVTGGSDKIIKHTAMDESILSTSKESYGSFPSHLSSEDRVRGHNPARRLPRSGSADESSVLSSSRLIQLERIHIGWKRNNSTKTSFVHEPQQARQCLQAEEDDADTAFIEDTQLGAQALQSQLQIDHSSTSEDTSGAENTSGDESAISNRSQRVQSSIVEHVRNDGTRSIVEVYSSDCSRTDVKESEPISDISKNFHAKHPSDFLAPTQHITAEPQDRLISQTSILGPLDFEDLSTDAFPPAPRVSIKRPGSLPSQVTKHLAAIKAQNPVRYKPSLVTRNPKFDDRGYWSLNCSHWSHTLQCDFWTSMREHVLRGSLGWGTTLHRNDASPQQLGQVRLYCWGEVAEHMWLMMWLCSEGKVAGAGAKWYDADGIAVITVA